MGDESRLGPVVLICSPECLEKGTLLAVAHKIIDTPFVKILNNCFGSDAPGLGPDTMAGLFPFSNSSDRSLC